MYNAIAESALVEERELIEDPGPRPRRSRSGWTTALFARRGRWRCQQWSTSIVDLEAGRLQHLT